MKAINTTKENIIGQIEDTKEFDEKFTMYSSHPGIRILSAGDRNDIKSYLISQRKFWYAKGKKEGFEKGQQELSLEEITTNSQRVAGEATKAEKTRILGLVDGMRTPINARSGALRDDILEKIKQRIKQEE